jgi:hypothetical protein
MLLPMYLFVSVTQMRGPCQSSRYVMLLPATITVQLITAPLSSISRLNKAPIGTTPLAFLTSVVVQSRGGV